jgi:hypothetical protein
MATVTDWQTLLTIQAPRSHMVRVKCWGIDVLNGPPEALQVRVSTSSTGGAPSPPDPSLSGHEHYRHQDTFLLLQGDQTAEIDVLLNDTTNPLALEIGVCYWIYPVTKRTDTREGTHFKGGYGTDCR